MSEPALMKFSVDDDKPLYLYVNPEENVFFIGSSIAEIKIRAAALNPNIDICSAKLISKDAGRDLNMGLDLENDATIAMRGTMFRKLVMSILMTGSKDYESLQSKIDAVISIASLLKSGFESAAVMTMLNDSYKLLSLSPERMARSIMSSNNFSVWRNSFENKLKESTARDDIDSKLYQEFLRTFKQNPKFANWMIS